ncbi:Nif3-like dinuclear metal center hexameric protein [Cytophagales bacterium LB-30]|uniref:GTP cyclohydrolase 1 type 2 homolog n=1 Tax=Shiella aurantiaca TaxID=3058365 RepID=A0ABT8F256_9BACT|nr:Nif3-like dinuclear metal center hexameric protein [Shiella aurantiaca]MDN4164121.1 Nif3-like dinuclear metal center hexameric protein [Shiella aurantiaca]
MTKIAEIIEHLAEFAPPIYQESYDNSGLICGNRDWEAKGVLISLDCTEAIISEAIAKGCNLVVAHHPIVFKGLKSLTGKNYIERTIISAIKHDIAIYAIHTNLDNMLHGVNRRIADKLDLQNLSILAPKAQTLLKLTTFIPEEASAAVLSALFEAGAGQVGHYKNCSFSLTGEGSFMPDEEAAPHIGEAHVQEFVHEKRVEVLVPIAAKSRLLQALKQAHPYEEVAYYLHALENENQEIGSGMIGRLPQAMEMNEFLGYLKEKMSLSCIRYTPQPHKKIQNVAVCGGAGSFLLPMAISRKADAFVTADFKYHEFFDAEDKVMICDIGHYESEVFTKDLIHDILKKKFVKFALCLSDTVTNPISYF